MMAALSHLVLGALVLILSLRLWIQQGEITRLRSALAKAQQKES